jgi:hypothetical protein
MSLFRMATQRSYTLRVLPELNQRQPRSWFTRSTVARRRQLSQTNRAPLTLEEITADPTILDQVNAERAAVDTFIAESNTRQKVFLGTLAICAVPFVLFAVFGYGSSSYAADLNDDDY